MSESNRVDLVLSEETTFNETPATPNAQELRFSTEGLGHVVDTVEDDELRDDRKVQDLVEVGVNSDGDLSMGLIFANSDRLLGGALCSTFGAFSGLCVDKHNIQAVAASQKLIRTTGSWTVEGFTVNQWVRTRGFSNAANNGLFKVSAVTTTDLTLTSGTASLVDEAAASGRVVQGLHGTTCVAGVDLTAANGDNSFTRASGSFITDGFQVGQRIRATGFLTASNNAIWLITAISSATKIIVSGAVAVASDVAAAGRALFGDHMRDGVTKRHFHLEKRFKDITKFISYRGQRVASASFVLNARSYGVLTFSFMGAKGVSADATVMAATVASVNTHKRIVAGSYVTGLKEGGSSLTVACVGLEWSVENGVEGVPTVTSKEYSDISLGTCVIKGKLRLYFADRVHYDKFQNQSYSSLEYQLSDAAGNVYYKQFPNIKYSNIRPVAGGKNQQIIIDCDFQALYSDTYDAQMMIDRIPV